MIAKNTNKIKEIPKIEQIAIKITDWAGSTSSLITHSLLFLFFILLIILGVNANKVMLVLTTLVSLEAIYLAIFIQMSVNRQTSKLDLVSEDVEEIQEDMEEIQKDVDEIQRDIDEIQEDVEEISEDIDEIEKDVDEIQKDIDEIQEDVDEIQEDVEEINEEDEEDDDYVPDVESKTMTKKMKIDTKENEILELLLKMEKRMNDIQKEVKTLKPKPKVTKKSRSLKDKVVDLLTK